MSAAEHPYQSAERANVIEIIVTFDKARSRAWAKIIAQHAVRTLRENFAEHLPRKGVAVTIGRIYDEEDDE